MKSSFALGVDARCTTCGTERDVPIGTADRVLESDALYADVAEACATCGAKRIRVEVKISDGRREEEAHLPDGDRPNGSCR